ncbi:MAG: hypothetical protein WD273_03140 [Trueperaceae bacterium]
MSRQQDFRTQNCAESHARTRFLAAEKFLEVAKLIKGEQGDAFRSVVASLAVLAGIAASDAACCKALGRRSRAESHHDAERLLERITPGGEEAAVALRRLIDLKDKAHYGFIHASHDDLKTAMRQAERLVMFADEVLRL